MPVNITPTPPPERFVAQSPTVNPPPEPAPRDAQVRLCGECPGWHRQNSRFFGQCIPALRALGAPLYTTDLQACSMPHVEREKYAKAAGLIK